MVATCAALGAITWALTHRAPSLLVRLGLTGASLYIGSVMWPHRPLLLGPGLPGPRPAGRRGPHGPSSPRRRRLAVGERARELAHGARGPRLLLRSGPACDGDEGLQERRVLLGSAAAWPSACSTPTALPCWCSRSASCHVARVAGGDRRVAGHRLLPAPRTGRSCCCFVGRHRRASAGTRRGGPTIPLVVFGVAAITRAAQRPGRRPGAAAGTGRRLRRRAGHGCRSASRPSDDRSLALGVVMIALAVMSVGRTRTSPTTATRSPPTAGCATTTSTRPATGSSPGSSSGTSSRPATAPRAPSSWTTASRSIPPEVVGRPPAAPARGTRVGGGAGALRARCRPLGGRLRPRPSCSSGTTTGPSPTRTTTGSSRCPPAEPGATSAQSPKIDVVLSL